MMILLVPDHSRIEMLSKVFALAIRKHFIDHGRSLTTTEEVFRALRLTLEAMDDDNGEAA